MSLALPLEDAFAGPFPLASLDGPEPLEERQERWRKALSAAIYGPLPPAPAGLEAEARPLGGSSAERIEINMRSANGARTLTVDAALWRPKGSGDAPLIAGLGFAGPVGILADPEFPLDTRARVHCRPELGVENGRLHDLLRGTESHRWPVEMLTARGYAVMVSCYGSWAPDDPDEVMRHGACPFAGLDTGAISLWAWAIQRLLDAAERLGGLDTGQVAVAGHSRLGKAALWAAANDARIGAVLANNSGCAGAAPAGHAVGETLAQMSAAFPHWVRPQGRATALDQHHLIACAAPRKVYVASAEQDLWADPAGSYLALVAASEAWPQTCSWQGIEEMWARSHQTRHAALGHHLRPGGHELLPYDWQRFLDFLDGGHE
ncbi:MAG: hypothetical protein F4Y60_11935 [Boseongicola sp. SB0664_bin_43]|uniref:4-O-methyl-glucuronoyl methylesterase-like domain-containing protein n=1 Tax=Boseongicola sp. SB0664_bin_43 TaxID=2604844 RepID=A0A6B0Y3U5_9RHOB|nr:hypothetical protein [Boseongicola sp. SB0664_bin_43]MYK31038.1 hypothetical protein [Boseongicola sp. SB0670_bin_30]